MKTEITSIIAHLSEPQRVAIIRRLNRRLNELAGTDAVLCQDLKDRQRAVIKVSQVEEDERLDEWLKAAGQTRPPLLNDATFQAMLKQCEETRVENDRLHRLYPDRHRRILDD